VAATTKKKVLVADDDPDTLRLVSLLLSRHGLTVITAEDGEEAFHKALTEKPDAVLLDTTGLSLEEQVARIVALARERFSG